LSHNDDRLATRRNTVRQEAGAIGWWKSSPGKA
jgi:hypothetical protein